MADPAPDLAALVADIDWDALPAIMTLAQLTELVPIEAATFYYWRWAGKGQGPPSWTLGKRVVFSKSDVRAWLEQQRAETMIDRR